VKHFTPEDDRMIRVDWTSYVPAEVIAKKLRRSTAVLRQRVHHLKLRRSPSVTRVMKWAPQHLVAKRRRLGDEGFIAEARQWRKEQSARPKIERRMAIEAVSREISHQDISRDEKIYLKRQAGVTLQRIADEFGITRQRVMQIEREVEQSSAAHRLERAFRRLSRGGKTEFIRKMGDAAT